MLGCKNCVEVGKNFGRNEVPSETRVGKFIKKVREIGILVDNKTYTHTHSVRTDEIIATVFQSVRKNPIYHRVEELIISFTSLRLTLCSMRCFMVTIERFEL